MAAGFQSTHRMAQGRRTGGGYGTRAISRGLSPLFKPPVILGLLLIALLLLAQAAEEWRTDILGTEPCAATDASSGGRIFFRAVFAITIALCSQSFGGKGADGFMHQGHLLQDALLRSQKNGIPSTGAIGMNAVGRVLFRFRLHPLERTNEHPMTAARRTAHSPVVHVEGRAAAHAQPESRVPPRGRTVRLCKANRTQQPATEFVCHLTPHDIASHKWTQRI